MRCRCASETLAILMASSQLSIKWASYRMYVKACTHYRWSCFESRGSKNCTITPTVAFLSVEWKREEYSRHSSTIEWLYHQNLILSIVEALPVKIFLLHAVERWLLRGNCNAPTWALYVSTVLIYTTPRMNNAFSKLQQYAGPTL